MVYTMPGAAPGASRPPRADRTSALKPFISAPAITPPAAPTRTRDTTPRAAPAFKRRATGLEAMCRAPPRCRVRYHVCFEAASTGRRYAIEKRAPGRLPAARPRRCRTGRNPANHRDRPASQDTDIGPTLPPVSCVKAAANAVLADEVSSSRLAFAMGHWPLDIGRNDQCPMTNSHVQLPSDAADERAPRASDLGGRRHLAVQDVAQPDGLAVEIGVVVVIGVQAGAFERRAGKEPLRP